jgi:hypothetical protein
MILREVEDMKTVDRQKMCPNCDGRIPHESAQCPYCFTTLQVEAHKVFNAPPVQENFLYNAPYSAKPAEEARAVPKSTALYGEKEGVATMEKEEAENKAFWPILLLTIGGNLFTLGILQFIFSDHGTVHLEINGSYWFLMLLVSLPLFYFGLKNISKN